MGSVLFVCTQAPTPLTMFKFAILLFVALVVVSEAKSLEPRDDTACSMDQILACGGEIGSAFQECISSFDIIKCIEEVLGASDCFICICDVLEFLGLMNCP